MKYSEQLKLSASWLITNRNPDGGWGLNPKQSSSIVNTAEALYVLNKAQNLPVNLDKSIQFLKEAIYSHPAKRGPFLRYYAFTILGLLSVNIPISNEIIQFSAEIIREKKIPGKGWGNSFKDSTPKIFPTFLALWALQMVEQRPSQETTNGLEWLLMAQKRDGGWGFTANPNENSNASATAYALIALKKSYSNDQRLQHGKSWLVSHAKGWLKIPILGESIGGTDWHHCNPAWASYALLECGESIFSPVVLETIQFFQTLFDNQVGSWRESQELVTTVRSTFWAVLALEQARDILDLNDVANLYSRKTKIIKIGKENVGFIPKLTSISLVIILLSVVLIFYIIFYITQLKYPILLSEKTGRIVIAILLSSMLLALIVGRKQISKKTLWISICIVFTILIFFWLSKNQISLILTALSVAGALLTLIKFLFR